MNLESHLLRLLKLACLMAFVCPQARGEEEDIGKLLDQAIEREVAKLQPNSLKLPAPKDGIKPPALIESAGKDFVDAWTVWRSVTAGRDVLHTSPVQIDRKELINAYKNWEPFEALLKRCIEADPPPDLAEFSKFTYDSLSWCGNSGYGFNEVWKSGMALCLLRKGQVFDAMQKLSWSKEELRDAFFRAFGVDKEVYRIGAWLNAQESYPLWDFCCGGRERTAGMMMDWVDMRWAIDAERRTKPDSPHNTEWRKEPRCARTELSCFLRPDNGVTEETKTRIAKFIESRGEEMVSADQWILQCPKGAEKWLAPLAWKGLEFPLNKVRKKASAILTAAGIEHLPPPIRVDPRFRIRINGKPWPGELADQSGRGPDLWIDIDYDMTAIRITDEGMQTGGGGNLRILKPDLMTWDADDFQNAAPITKVSIQKLESDFFSDSLNPNRPWLQAEVALPITFEKVNQVDLHTVQFTIRPILPDRKIAAEDSVYEVDFKSVAGGGGTLVTKGREPVTLTHVSPGEYRVRVRHPGALLGPEEKVNVSDEFRLLEPKLESGYCLVVPVDWPQIADPENPPPDLARQFIGLGFNPEYRLQAVIQLKRHDGSVVKVEGGTPRAANGRFPMSVIFPYLPPGEYEIESPDRTLEPEGTYPGCVIRKTSLKVEIRKDSPVFVVTKPLKIDYTRKD